MKTFVELVRDSLYAIIFHLAPRFANAIIFIIIGRVSGPEDAGVFTLSATYLLIFSTVAKGLDDLVVREVSRNPEEASKYLTNFLLLRGVLSLFLYGTLFVVVQSLFSYSEYTVTVILLLCLSLLPDSLSFVSQSVLLGLRNFKIPTFVLTAVSLFKLALGGFVILNDGNLYQIAWIWVWGSFLGFLAIIIITQIKIDVRPRINQINWSFLAQYRRTSLIFVFMTTLAMLETQTDTIILSGYHGELEVGWYGAATTIAYSLIMFAQGYRFAVYPLMSRYAVYEPEKLKKLYEQSIQFMGMLVFPMVIGIELLARKIVQFVFGHNFDPTIRILEIIILSLIFMFLNEPNIRIILVHDGQDRILKILFISATLNILLNFLLTPSFGTSGAAIARVCSSLITFILGHYYVRRYIKIKGIYRYLTLPMLASFLMAVILLVIRQNSLFMSIGVGMLVYIVIMGLFGGISYHKLNIIKR